MNTICTRFSLALCLSLVTTGIVEAKTFWACPNCVEKGDDTLHPLSDDLPKKVRLRKSFGQSTENNIKALKMRGFHVGILVECKLIENKFGTSTDEVKVVGWLLAPVRDGISPKGALIQCLDRWPSNNKQAKSKNNPQPSNRKPGTTQKPKNSKDKGTGS